MSAIRLLDKIFLCLLLFSFLQQVNAVEPKPVPDSLLRFEKNKEIPQEYRLPVLTALAHFPELKDVHIVFKIKKAYTPLTTKPRLGSIFKSKGNRTYVITISDKTVDTLTRLLYSNLDFDEQVGIIGHELSHVVDFDNKNFLQTIRNGIGHLSKEYIDRMEYNTDRICVQHGLGDYLEAYSRHVRETMHVHNWRGVDFVNKGNSNGQYERYMNPDTIEKYKSSLHPN